MLSPIKKGKKKKKKVAKREGEKPCILRGYTPFNFFEKEKFKGNIEFKEDPKGDSCSINPDSVPIQKFVCDMNKS